MVDALVRFPLAQWGDKLPAMGVLKVTKKFVLRRPRTNSPMEQGLIWWARTGRCRGLDNDPVAGPFRLQRRTALVYSF